MNLLDGINEKVTRWVGNARFQEGLYLRWTSFKADQGTSLLVGQWLAVPTSKEMRGKFMLLPSPAGGAGLYIGENVRGVYSSTPGKCSAYRGGECFDLSIQERQVFFAVEDLALENAGYAKAEEACQQALDVLKAFLKKHRVIEGV